MTNEIVPPSPADIEAWLVARIAALLDVAPEQVDATAPFATYGLDSVAAVGLVGELEEYMGIDMPPTLMWDFPTIAQLVRHLST